MIKHTSEPVAAKKMRGIENAEAPVERSVTYYNRNGECEKEAGLARVIDGRPQVLAYSDGLFYNNLYDPYETTMRDSSEQSNLRWSPVNQEAFDNYCAYLRSRKRGFYEKANLLYGNNL